MLITTHPKTQENSWVNWLNRLDLENESLRVCGKMILANASNVRIPEAIASKHDCVNRVFTGSWVNETLQTIPISKPRGVVHESIH